MLYTFQIWNPHVVFDLNNVTNVIKIGHSNMTHCNYNADVATLKLMKTKSSKSQLLKRRCNRAELKLITLINVIVNNYIITKYYNFGLGF